MPKTKKAKLKSKLFKNRFLLAVFAVGFAALGITFIHNSSAGPPTGYGVASVQVAEMNLAGNLTGNNVANATIHIYPTPDEPTYVCTQLNSPANWGNSGGSGIGAFTCGSWSQGRAYIADAGKAGYVSKGGYPGTVHIGQTTVFRVVLQMTDADGDNVPDISDSCPNQGSTGYGVGANGCPNAAPPINASFPLDLTVRYNPIDYGGQTSMYWTSAGATACSLERASVVNNTIGAFGSGISTPNGTQERNPGVLTATTAFRVYCSGQNGGAAAYSSARIVTVNPQPIVNAKINSFTAAPNPINKGTTSRLSYSFTNVATCVIGNPAIGWTKTIPNTSTFTDTPALSGSTEFSLTCGSSGNGSGASAKVTVAVNGDPTVIVVEKPGQNTTSTNTRVVTRTVTAPANASDKEKPSTPENFKAEQQGSGEVDLSWDASTDNVGVTGYTLERSTDGTDWTMLDDAITDTSYADSTAEFSTPYTYRLSAKDAAGNFSDYVLTDLATNEFSPNVTADEDSTVTSDDGIVEVKFPAGSLSEDAFCTISKDNVSSSPKGYKLVAGAYTIDCKNQAGDSITKLDKSAEVTMHLKNYAKKYGKFAAYTVDGNDLTLQQSSFNSSNSDLTFSLKELQAFAAFGAKKSSMLWIFILIPLILIALVLLIMRLRGGGGGSDDYYDTTDYVSAPPNAPVNPLDTGANGYQHHPTLPELVAQGQQPPQGPGQQPPLPPQ